MSLLPSDQREIKALLGRLHRSESSGWTHNQIAAKAYLHIEGRIKAGDLIWKRAIEGIIRAGLIALSRAVASAPQRLNRGADGKAIRLRAYVSVRQRKPDGTLSNLFINQTFLELPVDEADAYALQMKKQAADLTEIAEGYEAITHLRTLYPSVRTYGEAIEMAGWTLEREEEAA